MAKSKNKQVKISVNENELNALEDFVMCYNVCMKHRGLQTEEEFDEALRTCPNCKRKWKRKWNCARDIMCRLWRAYDKELDTVLLKEFKEQKPIAKKDYELWLKATRGVVKKAGITPKDLEVTIAKVRHAHPSKA
jgi:hypothetical protein